ncbi:hypothetical protein L618_005600000100 [Rhodococcus rhodochrous J45]|uniref:Uncharacterized protein n=1 Tax=Rhodococcus rhodochrous J45 TaxID=935266 RepID=A0A562DID9_RHORH|nr:hypothetical protein L618_005600000100 [Rhodococcus rhodochrous J45]
MKHSDRTTNTDHATGNSNLTDTDLAAVVAALTGEPIDHTDPATSQSARRSGTSS